MQIKYLALVGLLGTGPVLSTTPGEGSRRQPSVNTGGAASQHQQYGTAGGAEHQAGEAMRTVEQRLDCEKAGDEQETYESQCQGKHKVFCPKMTEAELNDFFRSMNEHQQPPSFHKTSADGKPTREQQTCLEKCTCHPSQPPPYRKVQTLPPAYDSPSPAWSDGAGSSIPDISPGITRAQTFSSGRSRRDDSGEDSEAGSQTTGRS